MTRLTIFTVYTRNHVNQWTKTIKNILKDDSSFEANVQLEK